MGGLAQVDDVTSCKCLILTAHPTPPFLIKTYFVFCWLLLFFRLPPSVSFRPSSPAKNSHSASFVLFVPFLPGVLTLPCLPPGTIPLGPDLEPIILAEELAGESGLVWQEARLPLSNNVKSTLSFAFANFPLQRFSPPSSDRANLVSIWVLGKRC